MAADLADKASDRAGGLPGGHNARASDARATCDRQDPLGATCHRALRFRFRRAVSSRSVRVERCVVFFIRRKAPSTEVVQRQCARNDAGRRGRDTANVVTFDQRRLLSDVAYNAQLGSAELGNDIASWRGSYILAFVAYNAGPRRAKEWIDQYGDPRDSKVDPVDWIERIPLSETRNYVQRIMENIQVYRARFDNNPRLLIEADLRRGG